MTDFRSSADEQELEQYRRHMLALDVQLCFALYSASRKLTAAFRPFLKEMNVTYPQYVVLLGLWEHPGLTMKELGRQLHLDYGTLSPIVSRLQAHGLVESVRSSEDGRAVILHATTKSFDLQDKAIEMNLNVVGNTGLSMEAVMALQSQVKDFSDRLDVVLAKADSNPTPIDGGPCES